MTDHEYALFGVGALNVLGWVFMVTTLNFKDQAERLGGLRDEAQEKQDEKHQCAKCFRLFEEVMLVKGLCIWCDTDGRKAT